MTLTQNGSNVTGNAMPVTVDIAGIVSTTSSTITGTVTGANVSLTFNVTVDARAGSDRLTCRGTDTFTGTIAGNSMTGTLRTQVTPYLCDGGIPLPVPQFTNQATFTKQ